MEIEYLYILAGLAARAGAGVAVADINPETGAETVEMVKAERREAILIEMDTSKKADALRMAEETLAAVARSVR